jgi:hypothetical protein
MWRLSKWETLVWTLKKLWCPHAKAWAENVHWEHVKKLPKTAKGKIVYGHEYMGLMSYCPDCGHAEFIPETEKWGAK